uniref:Uncharacterized protein n=1 Tax=uncultured bacterium 9F08 TaxID=697051 RepID=D2XIR0_9BACT|nr:hypothetical protein [uncultured bacterium 9F08]
MPWSGSAGESIRLKILAEAAIPRCRLAVTLVSRFIGEWIIIIAVMKDMNEPTLNAPLSTSCRAK